MKVARLNKLELFRRAEEFFVQKLRNARFWEKNESKNLRVLNYGLYRERLYEIFEKLFREVLRGEKWSELTERRKREVAREFLRRVISFHLKPDVWEDKSFQREKKHDERYEFGKVIVVIKRTYDVGCHPSPNQFAPRVRRLGIDKKRGKIVVEARISQDEVYESNRHYNKLRLLVFDLKETEKGFIGIARYSLYRYALGDYREFTFVFGYEDGSVFSERVSPQVCTIEEALEWMKPAEVKKAEEEGRRVFRQGDVFFVELKNVRQKITDYSLPHNHKAQILPDGSVLIKHHEHTALILPHPHFKPVVRKVLVSFTGD